MWQSSGCQKQYKKLIINYLQIIYQFCTSDYAFLGIFALLIVHYGDTSGTIRPITQLYQP